MSTPLGHFWLFPLLAGLLFCDSPASAAKPALTLSHEAPHWLVIHGDHIPGKRVRINYLEAYCRAGSTAADWGQDTVVRHQTQVISINEDKTVLRLRDKVSDGLIVEHAIKVCGDEFEFVISTHNPTDQPSVAHWDQPCIRLGDFTGFPDRGGDLND